MTSGQLTPLDATFLELEEADESAHMHIGGLLVFDPPPSGQPPSLQELRRHLEARLPMLPLYRCRLSQPHTGGLSWPSWVEDPGFDIETHVRHAALPAPGGERELLEWAADYWSQRLERHRPLWEVVLLEGVDDGRWALCTKTHHCLVDGMGSVDAAYLMLDAAPEGSGPPAAPATDASTSNEHRIGGALARGVRVGLDTALHPRKALDRSRAVAELLLKDELVGAPRTSLNGPIGTRRRYEVARAQLGEVKAIGRSLGGTVNDVVLAAATAGLRELLIARGDELPARGLRAMVPVNVRSADETLDLGNRISSLFVELPVAEERPLQRYALAVRQAEDLKSGTQAAGSAALVDLAGLAPPVVHSLLARSLFASRLFNVTITNVRGPQQTLYCLGGPLREIYPLVPLAADHAVGIAVISYDGNLFFGLAADHDAVRELPVLREGIECSLAELSTLAEGAAR